MLRQIHLLFERAQLLGQGLDLILVASALQAFFEDGCSSVLVTLGEQLFAFFDELAYGMAAEFGAGIFEQFGGDFLDFRRGVAGE